MGCDLRRINFSDIWVSSADFNTLCSYWSFSHFVKFYSFMFLHKISTRVVCVNGKYTQTFAVIAIVFYSCKLKIRNSVTKRLRDQSSNYTHNGELFYLGLYIYITFSCVRYFLLFRWRLFFSLSETSFPSYFSLGNKTSRQAIDPFNFFQLWHELVRGGIHRDHWKERLNIEKTVEFERDLLKTNEDIAVQSC